MSFGVSNALANPYSNYVAGGYDPMPMAAPSGSNSPDWLKAINDIVSAVDAGLGIYERIDYPSWKRAQDALALERERRLQEQAKANQAQAQAAGTPAWLWVALGVGGVAVLLLVVKQIKE
ncbi:hypothetical protein [Meiothermus sp.]|uniref:hypothetical protein n=1 Tax=Meiothermus sp. TaxID=1955249 RepID=UPI0021DD6501|nr:hypothetical protein [Meiothermus sp.]GIW33774.1 MAG: hypothetical protein KatS3mg072_1107 [Meiothermus sp.]